jgi:hypothetical protein
MIFGVNATRSAVVIAETKGAGDKFVITAIRPIPFQVRSGDDLGVSEEEDLKRGMEEKPKEFVEIGCEGPRRVCRRAPDQSRRQA